MYKLDLTQEDINVTLTALAHQPYHMVVGVMNSIIAQMTAQQKAAQQKKEQEDSEKKRE